MSSELARPADILQAIKTGEIPDLGDRKQQALGIVAQILEAETLEQIFDPGGTLATKDMIGSVFTLEDVQLMPGEADDAALPVYVLLRGRWEDGTAFVANSGSPRIIGQALAAQLRELLPLRVAVVEIGRAKAGQNAPLGLAVQ